VVPLVLVPDRRLHARPDEAAPQPRPQERRAEPSGQEEDERRAGDVAAKGDGVDDPDIDGRVARRDEPAEGDGRVSRDRGEDILERGQRRDGQVDAGGREAGDAVDQLGDQAALPVRVMA
jgi:hypothetical protein